MPIGPLVWLPHPVMFLSRMAAGLDNTPMSHKSASRAVAAVAKGEQNSYLPRKPSPSVQLAFAGGDCGGCNSLTFRGLPFWPPVHACGQAKGAPVACDILTSFASTSRE
eukprot:4986414-Alexandrium_andersonii.AAC.1